jgi:hypothetical protein
VFFICGGTIFLRPSSLDEIAISECSKRKFAGSMQAMGFALTAIRADDPFQGFQGFNVEGSDFEL